MATGSYNTILSAGGVSISSNIQRTKDTGAGGEYTLPVAQAGTLTTRTSDTVGEVTMTSGSHTITTAAIVDIYWDGGVRYGVTVGTVSGTAVPFTLGSGYNLPSASTAVVVVEQTVINLAIDGDNVGILGIQLVNSGDTTALGHVDFQDSGSASIAELDLTQGNALVYDIDGGVTNPFTGNPIATLHASQDSVAGTATLKIGFVVDATP